MSNSKIVRRGTRGEEYSKPVLICTRTIHGYHGVLTVLLLASLSYIYLCFIITTGTRRNSQMARFIRNEKISSTHKQRMMNIALLPSSLEILSSGLPGLDDQLRTAMSMMQWNTTDASDEPIPMILHSKPSQGHIQKLINTSLLAQHGLPAPFPITEEMLMPVPFSDSVRMVFAAIPRNDIVILFSVGLNISEVKVCSQGGATTKVFWHASNAKTKECCVLMFTCRRHSHWKQGQPISVSNGISAPLPSTAFFHPALTEVPAKAPRYFLCVAAIVRNVARFIPDWVRYHRHIGVDRFFIFNNNSTDLHGLPPLPDVELIPWPWKRSQRQAYSYAAVLTQSRCAWLAAIDVDEYVFPRAGRSFAAIVRGLDRPGNAGLVLRSMTMTTPDLRRCADDSVPVPERYLHRQPAAAMWEYNPKTVVRPAAARGLHSVHTCLTEPPRQAWVPRERAHIVHYKLPCWPDYYAVKLRSGRAASAVDIRWSPGEAGPDRPLRWVLDLPRRGNYTVVDTAFRDFKRRLEASGRPPPPPAVVP